MIQTITLYTMYLRDEGEDGLNELQGRRGVV